MHLNIRSLPKNIDNLTLLLSELEVKGVVVHVIAVCETFVTKLNFSLMDLENYRSIHKCRSDKMGGGVSLFLHDRIKQFKPIDCPFTESFESVAVEFNYLNNNICVSEVYRPPNSDDLQFMSGMKTLVDKVNNYDKSFVCGDFNYDLLKSHLHSKTGEMLSFFLDSQFAPYIVHPTRVTHSTSTLIDNIFV